MRSVTSRAPARLDFGGGWTDVPPYSEEQGGCVCNVAITRYAHVEVRANSGADASPSFGDRPQHDAPLLAAAMRRMRVRDASVTIRNDFPVGAGLGGSSAAGVALIGALAAWRGDAPTHESIAETSRDVEVEDVGIAGGRQDHYAAALGGALGIWFGDGVRAERIPLTPAMAEAIARQCLVIYTGASRISGSTITAVIDSYRTRTPRVVAALARMKALAESMIDAMRRGSFDDLAALVDEHWAHQRALHPAITTPAIEAIVASAHAAGALGVKALGASGGGCVLVMAPAEHADRVARAITPLGELLLSSVDTHGLMVESIVEQHA